MVQGDKTNQKLMVKQKNKILQSIRKPFYTTILLVRQYGYRGLIIAVLNKLHGYDLLYGLSWIGNEKPVTPEKEALELPIEIDCVMPAYSVIDEWIMAEMKSTSATINSIYEPCIARIEPKLSQIKKKILIVSHELSRTGAPGVLLEACKTLCNNGYFVTVLAPLTAESNKRELAKDFAACGIHVILDRTLLAYRWRTPDEIPEVVSPFLNQLVRQYDLLLCNSYSTHNIVQSYNGKNIPVIWWLHEGKETYTGGRADSFPQHLKNNVRVYCVSDYSRKTLKSFNIDCETDILTYGIKDKASLYPEKLGDKIKFVLCGLIDPRKNQKLLLKAVNLLPVQIQNKAEFVIVGGYNNEKYYRSIVKMADRLGCVSILGSVSNDEVMQQYQSADCIVLPSVDDPMPVVLTEGMMLSKIILCSDRTGTSSLIEDGINGYVFGSKDAQQLSKIIEYIINHARTPGMKKIKQGARAVFEHNFTIERFEENFLNAVESAIR